MQWHSDAGCVVESALQTFRLCIADKLVDTNYLSECVGLLFEERAPGVGFYCPHCGQVSVHQLLCSGIVIPAVLCSRTALSVVRGGYM